MSRKAGLLIESEEKRIMADPGYNSVIHQRHSYLSRGYYYDQITRWLRLFPVNQFLFIKSEDFFSNSMAEMENVYRFLEIKNHPPENLKPFNTGKYSPADLSDGMMKKLSDYFREKNKLLPELIGSKFDW